MLVFENQSKSTTLKMMTLLTHAKQQIFSLFSHTNVWESDKRTWTNTVHCSSLIFIPMTPLWSQNTQNIFKIKGAQGAQKVLKKLQIHVTWAQNTKKKIKTLKDQNNSEVYNFKWGNNCRCKRLKQPCTLYNFFVDFSFCWINLVAG